MNQQVLVVAQALALVVAASSVYAQAPDPIEPRHEWYRDLDIEAAVAQSELILVTRIDEVKEIPLPVGGKGESVMLQIQFKPVRVLKGVFAREGLTLTSYDLGIAQSRTRLDRLKAGDMRLLFLGRSQSGYQNRNIAPDVDRSLPLLRDEQDPMTSTVSTLLAVHAASNRERRVTLLTEALARTRGAATVPLLNAMPRRALLAAFPLNAQERHAFAMAANKISTQSPKHRALYPLATPLATMLDPGEGQTRYIAIAALVKIDAPAAARALQPHLREETNLSQKLLMAEFLGRHGIRDGYPYAVEHMSEPHLLERAVVALAAIGETRAIEESRRILETSNDEAWNGAAIRVLGAMDVRSMAPRFLEMVEDWKNPLAPAALESLALIDDPRLNAALASAVTDAGLEGTNLLGRIEELLRERKVRLAASSG